MKHLQETARFSHPYKLLLHFRLIYHYFVGSYTGHLFHVELEAENCLLRYSSQDPVFCKRLKNMALSEMLELEHARKICLKIY